MANEMKDYELFLVFSMNLGEEGRESLLNKFCEIIKKSGQIDKIDKWGKRRLAYSINKEHDGFYVLVNFKSTSEIPAEITRIARITNGLLRYLVVKNEEEI
jgi:small subunit ribosomal protein S6